MSIKEYVYDCIIDHLLKAKNDSRRREQKRAKIALKTINKWKELAKKELAK